MPEPSPALPVDVVTYVVNEWGTSPRREAGELDRPFPSPATVFAGLDDVPRTWRRVSEPDLRRLADDLHPVFAAAGPAERATALTDLVRAYGLGLRLDATDAGIALGLEDPSAGASTFRAAAVTTLLQHLTSRGSTRVGVCAAPGCVDVWADPTGGRPRRYCSVGCSGRARVASFRRRHREAPRSG